MLIKKLYCYFYFQFIQIAVAYGSGVYFARNAKYSVGYAPQDSLGMKRMFLCRIVVGNCTTGNSSIKTPPQGFNSTTDAGQKNASSIFVVYHDDAAYPEYLITFQ